MLIDTHCHLDMISQPIVDVLDRAKERGVEVFITQGTNVDSSVKAVALAQRFPEIYATVGIHPEEISSSQFSVLNAVKEIETLISKVKVVAVGEVGLDYYIVARSDDEDEVARGVTKQRQMELFKTQILLAIKHKKALVVHDRDAIEDTMATLQGVWVDALEYRTVFHCCPADERLLQYAVAHHVYIGIDGDITWSKKKQRFIKTVPLELLVLETDSPFLVPLELKVIEKENEPKNISVVRDMVALIKEVLPQEVERVTTENATRLFSLSHLLTE